MIEFKEVSFSYPEQETGGLQSISLNISEGECVLLCGRSGCGKTTVTRLVNGLIPYFYPGELEGEVLVHGRPVSELPMYEIAKTAGSVFQNPRTQFFNVDTDSEIAFGLENEAVPSEVIAGRVSQTARELQIENLRGRNLFELSGGEKQKIAFASVYAMNPDIYLLDEPSSNLDMGSIQELRKHLSLIKAQGKTILIAEHRLFYLMDIADRIVYLEQGQIAGIYTPAEFLGMDEEQRKQMGLRAVKLDSVKPETESRVQNMPLLELRDVSLFYKKRLILGHISLQASSGEVIAVVGNNGAGKTTFSRALCGLHRECGGSFCWKGVESRPGGRLKHSYMVMQDVGYELFADSVAAEVSFGIRNPDVKQIQDTMDTLGLLPVKDRHPNTLSGGQKQRVAAAVSMICGRELLVFDEPTSGLDYDSMAQVAALIGRLASMGKLIFVVTHDYEFVCKTCTRVLRFDKRELTEDLQISGELLGIENVFQTMNPV